MSEYRISPVAQALAVRLTDANVKLSAKPNGVLTPLVHAFIQPVEVEEKTTAKEVNTVAVEHYKSVATNPFVSNEGFKYGVAVEEFQKCALADFKPIVLGFVNKLKTIVIPTVKSIFDKAYEETQDLVATGGVRLSVVTDGSELAVWTNTYLESINCEKVDLSRAQEYAKIKSINFSKWDDSQLDGLLATKSDLFDADISELWNFYDKKEALEYAYHNYIACNADSHAHKLQSAKLNSLIMVLLTDSLIHETPENIIAPSLDVYTDELTKCRDFWYANYQRHLQNETHDVDNGILVIQYPDAGEEYSTNAKIVVNGLLLDKFVKSGGEVDAIYGGYCSDRPTTMSAFIDNLHFYLQKWTDHMTVVSSNRLANFQSTLMQRIYRGVIEFIEDKDIKITESDLKDLLHDTSTRAISTDDAFSWSRGWIIKMIFKDDRYTKLLDRMDTILGESGDDGSADAAFEIALSEMLVDWVFDHIEVKGA